MSITDDPLVPSGAPEDWCLPGVERLVAVDAVQVVDAKADALPPAVQAMLDDDPAGLPDEVVLERQRAVLPLIERLKVVALHGLRVIDARELHALDGAPTASAWMKVQPVAPDGITVHTARRLGSLRHAAAEAAAGRLSVRDASTIGAALDKVPADVDETAVVNVLVDGIGDQLAALHGGDSADAHQLRAELAAVAQDHSPAAVRLETGFVTFARQIATVLPAGALRRHLDLFVDALLPDKHDERDRTLHDDRHLDLEPVLDGGWHLRGLLDAETGEALKNALDRFSAPTNKNDDPRTATQKRHDALRELCELSASHADAPKSGSGNREIVVYARRNTLERQPGALPAKLASGMPVAPATLKNRLACGALFTAILLDEAGQPLHVGRTRRLFSAAQRRAMHVQCGGLCAGNGCTNPGEIRPPRQVLGGRRIDRPDNGLPVCRSTHHDIQTGRKTIQLKDGRWIGPEGFVDGPSP